MHVSASIGAAMAWQDGTATEGLYKKADSALYRAKEAGRDTWRMDTTDVLPGKAA
jgi:GGDEF domain-containing protein